jgi:hypothetical protein
MVCENCGAKMACRYSVPVGQQLRYRTYRCEYCRSFLDTAEMPLSTYRDRERVDEVVAKVEGGKRAQLSFIYKHKQKRGGAQFG